jgi:glucose-6-phosphate 1-epimerase
MSIRVEAGQGGLERVVVDRSEASAELYLQGATLTSWRPAGHEEVLWVSAKSHFKAERPIRGGVPVCFPWFGPKAGAPQHGFVRAAKWQLDEAVDEPDRERARIELRIESDDAMRAVWPHRFSLRYRISVGRKLELALLVTNTGEEPFTFEELLHPYFTVKDIRNVRIHGLDGMPYADKVDGGAMKREAGTITFAGETDRVHPGASQAVEIEDPGLSRRISIQKERSLSTVVWNPWIEKSKAMNDFGDDEWPSMVCVEPGNVGPDAITLAPKETHEMRALVVVNA